jgi:hypothetical protein
MAIHDDARKSRDALFLDRVLTGAPAAGRIAFAKAY